MALPRPGTKSQYPRLRPKERREEPGAFSKGGRLLQIEYARECPNSGSLAVAVRFRSGVLLAKARLVAPELGHRIPILWRVTPRSAYVANGNVGDMFYLRDVISDRGPRTRDAVARIIRETLHDHAVRRDVRPLALAILLGSAEGRESTLHGFDVTGSQFECDGWALGQGSLRARDYLLRSSVPDMALRGAEETVRGIYGKTPFESMVLQGGRALPRSRSRGVGELAGR